MNRVFEIRTYRSATGKLDALLARFRDHAMHLFAEHDIGITGFWHTRDESDETTGTLVYVCHFDSQNAADEAWTAFRSDPHWIAVRNESQIDGPLTESVESLFLEPADFSPIR